MLGWIFGLPWRNPEDFWLNVVAGVPFMVFDILIITMLLPVTIQWWTELRWEKTRLVALQHLLEGYAKCTLAPLSTRIVQDRTITEHERAIRHLDDCIRRVEAAKASRDGEVQTALPILGPDITAEVLEFHYSWVEMMDSVIHLLGVMRTEHFRLGEIMVSSPITGGLSSIEDQLGHFVETSVAQTAAAFHGMKIRYARDGEIDQRLLVDPIFRFTDFAILVTGAHAYFSSKLPIDDLRRVEADQNVAFRAELTRRLSGKPIQVYRRRQFWQWLRRRDRVWVRKSAE